MIAIGPAIIGSGDPWEHNRALITRMRPEVVRVRSPVGFQFRPARLRDLIADGVQTVILSTEDGTVHHQQVDAEIRGRGFTSVIADNPDVEFIVALGNEPDLVSGLDMWGHRFYCIRTIEVLRAEYSYPNLKWGVSMPTNMTDTEIMLADDAWGSIPEVADVLCPHIYGWHNLTRDDGEASKFYAIIDKLIDETSQPLWITEAGIDDRDTAQTIKAKRYLEFADAAPDRIAGVCFWGIGDWPENPTMEIDTKLADRLAERFDDDDEQPPEMSIKEAVEHIQNWARQHDPLYERVTVIDD